MHLQRDPAARAAGQHARATVRHLRLQAIVVLGMAAAVTTAVGSGLGVHDRIFLGADVALLVVCLVVARFVVPLVDRRERGAAGEEHVGAILEGLAVNGWRVIHDVTAGRGNVDHILVGPAGLFTVETKSHPGPIRVHRVHGATLTQALAQQKLVERLTGMRVEPLLVYSRAWVDRPCRRRKGVRIIPASMLASYLAERKPTLSRVLIDELHGQLAAALQRDVRPLLHLPPRAGPLVRRKRSTRCS